MLTAINGAKPADDCAEPEILADDLLAVRLFYLIFLPASFRPLVADIAETYAGAVLDLPAAVVTAVLLAASARCACIYPRREAPAWEVVPNLWGASTRRPGSSRARCSTRCIALLVQIADMKLDRRVRQPLRILRKARERRRTSNTWCGASSKRRQRRRVMSWNVEPYNMLKSPVKRLARWRWTHLSSNFKELLVYNPAGLMVLRDELVGLIAEMDKEGLEHLSARSSPSAGTAPGSFPIDDIARGSIDIPQRPPASVFGSIEVEHVLPLLSERRARRRLGGRRPARATPDHHPALCVSRAAARWIERRLTLLWCAPRQYPPPRESPDGERPGALSPDDAQEMFFASGRVLEEKVRFAVAVHPALRSHLANGTSLSFSALARTPSSFLTCLPSMTSPAKQQATASARLMSSRPRKPRRSTSKLMHD